MGEKLTATGNIVAEDVIIASDYIYISSYENLKYYQTGFISYPTENDTTNYIISNIGYMKVEYTIDIENCIALYKKSEESTAEETILPIEVIVHLNVDSINNNSIISYKENDTVICSTAHKLKHNNTELSSEILHNSSDEYTIHFNLDNIYDIEKEYVFTIEYIFTVQNTSTSGEDNSLTNYQNYIYKTLNSINFRTSALVNEVTDNE